MTKLNRNKEIEYIITKRVTSLKINHFHYRIEIGKSFKIKKLNQFI